jgi:RNA polymerase sigma-70 factor (ECF subfamily)
MPGGSDSSFADFAGLLPLARAKQAESVPVAFEALYRQHFDFVFRSVRRLGIADAQIDDVVQEVFLVVLRRLSDFRAGTNARAWLFSIASRTSANHRRGQRRSLLRHAPLGDPADCAPGAFERAACSDAARLLQRFLDGLSDDKRDLFILSDLEGMSGPELAAVYSANLNTIYARIRSVRQELAAFLAARGTTRVR